MIVTIATYTNEACSAGVSGLLFFVFALKITLKGSDYLIGS